ncbi:MAG: DUF4328 domain-containing protein [Bacteroidales bacterium]
MKKITNNSILGKITMLFNLLILVLFIVSMVFILKFDEINVVKVRETPHYEKALETMRTVEHPIKQNQAEVEYYTVKLDTLSKKAPKDKKEATELKEDIDRTKQTLSDKKAALAATDSTIAAQKVIFDPIQTHYNDLCAQTEQAKSKYTLLNWILCVVIVIKIILFAFWTYKNSKNLHHAANWMNKGASSYWAFLGWIIPVYNFVKPYTFFSEIWNETAYLLKDKSIVARDQKDDNSDFILGIWWSLFLIGMLLVPYFINGVFMQEGPMFLKLNHTGIIITAIVFWALYLLQESNVIRKYNKMNKIMFDNQDKF